LCRGSDNALLLLPSLRCVALLKVGAGRHEDAVCSSQNHKDNGSVDGQRHPVIYFVFFACLWLIFSGAHVYLVSNARWVKELPEIFVSKEVSLEENLFETCGTARTYACVYGTF